MMRRLAALFCLTLMAHGLPAARAAEPYPDKPIRILVGYAPGGSADTLARMIGQALGRQFGQPVIIENRPGASGNIAATAVARAAPDGYTLFLGSNATAINMTLYRNLPFDLRKSFTPVGMIGSFPNVLTVTPGFPARTLRELVDYAKHHPGQVNFGSSGTGSSTHLSGVMFEQQADVTLTHIPYKGSAPALTDLMTGQIDVMFDNAPSSLPYVQSGKLRALAVLSPARLDSAPNIPTSAEAGLPHFQIKSWYGLFAPRGTPEAVVAALNAGINKALSEPDLLARFKSMGVQAEPGTPQSFDRYVNDEIDRWGKIVRTSGASAE